MENQDLDEIQKEIARRKELQVCKDNEVPPIPFNETPNGENSSQTNKASELVESAFQQAIINVVTTEQEVQDKLLSSAGKIIDNKLEAIKSKAEQEDKEAHFNNKKGACECFGYNETTTEKWAVNVMNFWHNIMTAVWLIIGFFTFAPITFVAKKITVIFKRTWIAITLAIIIYLAVILTPILTGLL